MSRWTMHHGDCLEWMRTLPDKSVDAIVSDPSYPEISRDYGRLSEPEWHVLMRGVVEQSRRVLKPSGSAVFILQPNSERVGRMRPWLWEFLAWTAREWNQVQDAWWWNTAALPLGGEIGLMRPSLKACVGSASQTATATRTLCFGVRARPMLPPEQRRFGGNRIHREGK